MTSTSHPSSGVDSTLALDSNNLRSVALRLDAVGSGLSHLPYLPSSGTGIGVFSTVVNSAFSALSQGSESFSSYFRDASTKLQGLSDAVDASEDNNALSFKE